MKKMLFAVVVIALTAGCAKQTFNINGTGSLAKEEMQTFFISGLGQSKEMDAAKVCGGAEKIAKVEVQWTPLNIVLGMVTFGIYTPRDARVYCEK